MAFFSNLAKTFSTALNGYDIEEQNNLSGTFVNTSQTAPTVASNMITKMISGTPFAKTELDINNIEGNYLNSTANKYVLPIDYTEFGDMPSSFLATLNKYNNDANTALNTESFFLGPNKELQQVYTSTDVVPSIFNPYVGIKARGMNTNQPLVDYDGKTGYPTKIDTSDCSIWNLLKISTNSSYGIGNGTSVYKLADFMYCKNLGKVSNNHLITLRRYKVPVGDNIYYMSNTGDEDNLFSCLPDVAHMVTWFGTDDNKLSDIVKMTFNATWKPIEVEESAQNVPSQADSEKTGILGMVANTLNPAYNKAVGAGVSGNHNLTSWLGSKHFLGNVNFGKPGQYEGNEALTNYDKHKIYTPKNTIQSNHYYEGKILFNHEFTLNFSYKLRSYDNLNQKSAMIDLINNILLTTFTRGTFWGGSVKLIGAPGNNSSLKKMNAFVDETWDKLAGFAENVLTGAVNWQELLGSLSDAVGAMVNSAGDAAKKFWNEPTSVAKEYGEKVVDFWQKHDFSTAVKGALKNTLGRPALYAINSFVSGENLGLWHVTIGNPLNPIMVIGNLIVTNTELSFGDCPLGMDDFPTEIRCAVTLKHCKPRDLTDISRMFTKGEGTISLPLEQKGWTNYYTNELLDSVNGNSISKEIYNEKTYQQTFGTYHMSAISNNFSQ